MPTEKIEIETTRVTCAPCEAYTRRQKDKPVVVMSCEGGCLRGEIARRAANKLCFELAPEKTARLCLGGAFTKDGGQRAMARDAQRLIALEGCPIDCASRMMKGAVPGLQPEVIVTDKLVEFDRRLFGIDEMPEAEIEAHASEVARQVAARL